MTPSQPHQASWIKGLAWLLLPLAIAGAAYFLILFSPRFLSRSLEAKLFADLEPFHRSDICRSLTVQPNSPFNQMVQKLFPLFEEDKDFSVSFSVVAREEINAFAFPGGKIYILDGLLKKADTPEEVAGVLAHEIEHVKLRHATRGLTQSLLLQSSFYFVFGQSDGGFAAKVVQELLSRKFSRQQEREADEGALERLKKAEISATGFKTFFEKMEKSSQVPDLLSTHPSDSDRARLAEVYLGLPSKPLMTQAEWVQLKTSCRKEYGKW